MTCYRRNALQFRRFLVVATLIAVTSGCSTVGSWITPTPRVILPEGLQPKGAESVALKAHFDGEAQYRCTGTAGERGRLAWQVNGLTGVLRTAPGEIVGTVQGLANWSMAEGTVLESAPGFKAPALHFGAPDWTRFDVHTVSILQTGRYRSTKAIVMAYTEGGHPADLRCGYAQVGTELKFPVRAQVWLYE